uniref:Reverse transcriptase zinc-binding domain-containing protein n=1 Tax=Bracon brevicornis TaxID=1563983 RepID=A0A6V7KNJ0_9HYME
MGSVGPTLATHKTEAVLFTSRKPLETITLNVGECSITSQPYIRYSGVMLDWRLSHTRHVERVTEKASRVAMLLARLMPNIGGPRQDRRQLLASVVVSVLTYGIAICGEVLEMETYRRKVAAVHQISALRVACAFRTISNDAVSVIANMMPIEVIAVERKQLYAERGANPAERKELRRNVKQRSIELWQQKWSASVKGRWTHGLIPKLDSWINCQHGEVHFYLTQMLSNHGCFRAYLPRFKHENIPDCPAGCGTPEDAEHVFFYCARFGQAREELNVRPGGGIEPETIVRFMLEKEENCSAVSSFAKDIMTKLREEERSRRKAREPETIAPRVMKRRLTNFWKH